MLCVLYNVNLVYAYSSYCSVYPLCICTNTMLLVNAGPNLFIIYTTTNFFVNGPLSHSRSHINFNFVTQIRSYLSMNRL